MRMPNFKKNRGPQFSFKNGDDEITVIKRSDGTVYTQTKAVASASTVWLSCGLGAVGFACYALAEMHTALAAGVIHTKSAVVFRAIDSVQFTKLVTSDLHMAICLAVIGTVCICIGMARWYANKPGDRLPINSRCGFTSGFQCAGRPSGSTRNAVKTELVGDADA